MAEEDGELLTEPKKLLRLPSKKPFDGFESQPPKLLGGRCVSAVAVVVVIVAVVIVAVVAVVVDSG